MNFKKLSAILAALLSSSAFAVNGAQHYTPVVNEAGILTLHSSSYGESSKFGMGINYNLAIDPEEFGGESRGKLKNYVHSLNIGIGSKIMDRVHIYADFSAHYLNPIGSDLDAALGNDSNFVLGNIDVGAGYSIIDNSEGGFGLGVTAHVVAPIGTKNAYLDGPRNADGKRAWQYGAVVAADFRGTQHDLLLVNAGYDKRASQDYILWGIGYQKGLFGGERHNVLFEFRGEQNFDDPKATSLDRLASTDALEADIAYKAYCMEKRGSYVVGIGRGFNHDAGSPDLRVMLGVNWQLDRVKKNAEPTKEAARPIPAPTPAPVVTPAPPAPVEEKVVVGVTTLKVGKIYFANNKDTILEKSHPALDKLATDLDKNPGLKKLQVEGYTDNVGNADYNKDLSKRRAESVKKYLSEKGIDGKRLSTEGYGEENPIASNDTPAGKASNRRVEFRILEVDGNIKMDLAE